MITLRIKVSGLIFFVAVTCVVVKLLSEKRKRQRRTLCISARGSHEAKEPPCDKERSTVSCDQIGATIFQRLFETIWYQEISKFFDEIDFMRDAWVHSFAGEQLCAFKKNVLSMKVIHNRFRDDGKDISIFFTKMLEVYEDALSHLKKFAHDVLENNQEDYEACAEAQSCAHCLYFIANNGSCAEVISALVIINFERNRVFGRLQDALYTRGMIDKHIVFFDLPREWLDLASKAVNVALQMNGTNWAGIETSARLLHESERVFWETIMNEHRELDAKFRRESFRNSRRESYWDSIPKLIRPELSTLSDIDSDSEFKMTVVGGKSGSVALRSRVGSMSDTQVSSEIDETNKQTQSMSSRFNRAADLEELSHGSTTFVNPNRSPSSRSDGAGRTPTEKELLDKLSKAESLSLLAGENIKHLWDAWAANMNKEDTANVNGNQGELNRALEAKYAQAAETIDSLQSYLATYKTKMDDYNLEVRKLRKQRASYEAESKRLKALLLKLQ